MKEEGTIKFKIVNVGETFHQAMLNLIDIEEALEELSEAESSRSMV